MKCPTVKSKALCYLYGGCSENDAHQVEDHVHSCMRCRRLIENLEEIQGLCAKWPEQPIDKNLVQTVLLKIRPEIVTPAEIALYLRISVSELMVNLEGIPHFKIGKNIRFRREAILKWLNEIETHPQHGERDLRFCWDVPENRVRNIFVK